MTVAPRVLGLGLLHLLFLAAATLFLLFIVFSGAIDNSAINKWYWIQVNTNGIPNAENYSRWTFWGICSSSDGSNYSCDNLRPDFPFSPQDNFNTTDIPSSFVNNRDTYYYLTRFSFPCYIIALAFVAFSFILSIFSSCFQAARIIVVGFTALGLLFSAAAACFNTAAYTMGKNAFNKHDHHAKLGPSLFGFAWATVALLLLIVFTSCCSGFVGSIKNRKRFIDEQKNNQNDLETGSDKRPFFRRYHHNNQSSELADEPVINYNLQDPSARNNTQTSSGSGIRFFKVRGKRDGSQ